MARSSLLKSNHKHSRRSVYLGNKVNTEGWEVERYNDDSEAKQGREDDKERWTKSNTELCLTVASRAINPLHRKRRCVARTLHPYGY
jgi:hypothetical protein